MEWYKPPKRAKRYFGIWAFILAFFMVMIFVIYLFTDKSEAGIINGGLKDSQISYQIYGFESLGYVTYLNYDKGIHLEKTRYFIGRSKGQIRLTGECRKNCLFIFTRKNVCVTPTARIFIKRRFDRDYQRTVKRALRQANRKLYLEVENSKIIIEYHGEVFAHKFNVKLCRN